MVSLPLHLQPYRTAAEQALKSGVVKEIEFSGPTYQVLVEDPSSEKEVWVFLQLTSAGKFKDAFCSCESDEEAPGCLHIAIAILSIYGNETLPLHERFENSLWNSLCKMGLEKFGDEPEISHRQASGEYFIGTEGNLQFRIQAKTAQARRTVKELLSSEHKETEETSIKFSNLTEQQIEEWRAGSPNPALKYALSFWYDLAKWLLGIQEDGQAYVITFQYSDKGLPKWIEIDFADLAIGFSLSADTLPAIIPALTTVHSPLAVRELGNKGVEQITYDKKKGTLNIVGNAPKKTSTKKAAGITLDEWRYIQGEGFYRESRHVLLETPRLEGEALDKALTEHSRFIADHLQDEVLHLTAAPVSYTLKFDAQQNLQINMMLFEPGDLNRAPSRLFGDWVFLEGKGFYRLEGKRFEELKTVIPSDKVADFVTRNRNWLNRQKGFRVHGGSADASLRYNLTAQQRLVFTQGPPRGKGRGNIAHFGPWTYVEGEGFYSKTSGPSQFLLRNGLSLNADQIPLFIKMHSDELSLIPDFFSSRCPLIRAKLRLDLGEKEVVKISPVYDFATDYTDKEVLFFDEFVYVDGEGFHELPPSLRLPEKFREPETLKGRERDMFLQEELETLLPFIDHLDPRLVRPKTYALVAHTMAPATEKGRGWYRVELRYQTEQGELPLGAIWKGLKKKEVFAFLPEGLIYLQDHRFDWLRVFPKERFDSKDNTLLLTALDWMKLHAFETITLVDDADARSQQIWKELTELQPPDEPTYTGLQGHLRKYQEVGVRWLWFLYRHQLSGLLCDEMGLGKTHQAMALFSSIVHLYRTYGQAEGSGARFLVVCPTSVIYHWQDKLHQFLPDLKIHTFHGTQRSLEGQQYDVLLTSYGILRRECEQLSHIAFDVIILDEIQIAKNQTSRIYAALRKIKSQMKLGMTGTPIENRLRELKSLFDIVLPSYMPNEADYRALFIKPIEKDNNIERKHLLQRLISPFTLRRKKSEVLQELPEKVEEVAYCDLAPPQMQLYNNILQQRRQLLVDELHDEKAPIPFLHIFALLSSLKQICDHPALYLKTPADYQQYHSGKWDLFLELLMEARESEQKVVVFSQYLGMLDIIEQYLTENGMGFASLRGATQDRKGELQRFNNDPECVVFVGSLQAAGLGIDLTAGSVVIHYDRWWNAARENQATDRVHRIGQTRNVEVFKLVTKGTFEEKIDAMITRKGKLMEDVIGIDAPDTLKRFTREELLELLEEVKSH